MEFRKISKSRTFSL